MSTGFTIDRRQSPRLTLAAGVECSLGLRSRVKLIDISLSGILLGAEIGVPAGAPAQLDTGLGAGVLRADLQVRRTARLQPDTALTGLGAMFTAMDERSRRCLEDFLLKAGR